MNEHRHDHPQGHAHDHTLAHPPDAAAAGQQPPSVADRAARVGTQQGQEAHAGGEHPGGHDAHGGHDKHAGHSVAMFRDKFWITLLLTVPTVIWSGMIQNWFGYAAPQFPGSRFIPAVFGTAVYLYGG